jgi:WD40 repeat protein
MPRRLLVAAAIMHYQYEPDWDRPELADDVTRMTRLLCETFGYEAVPVLTADPTWEQLHTRLRDFARSCLPEDYVAVYLTGHGYITTSRSEHILLPSDADPNDELGRALKTSNIAELMLDQTPLRRLMVILDTCHAGSGGAELAGRALGAQREVDGLAVITATCPHQQAHPGVFTKALVRAARNRATAGYAVPALAPDAIVALIRQDPAVPSTQKPDYFQIGAGKDLEFLPNPDFQPQLVGLDLDTQERLRRQLGLHLADRFVPAARWFTGRDSALMDLTAWLTGSAEQSTNRCKVVTGGPGSGKTAVLGLLAALSHPDQRAAVPRGELPAVLPSPGVIDAAIYAGNQPTTYVLAQIAAAAGLDMIEHRDRSAQLRHLLDGLLQMERPVTVLIDALDEAVDPQDLTRGAIRSLIDAGYPQLRLLLGTRSHLVNQLGPHIDVLDLDDETYADPADICEYARRVLLEAHPDSPYRMASASVLNGVAAAVATAAGKTFLVARFISQSLASAARAADPTDPRWRASLPGTAGEAMSQDLRVRLGVDANKAAELLLPLAYAQGVGMPWEGLWPHLASALTPHRSYTDTDIQWLRQNAGAYVVESMEADRSAYRLFHQSFTEHLRRDRDESADQAVLGQALTRCVPPAGGGRRDWNIAHPYIRTHLATHAARGDQIDDLLSDPDYLLAAARPELLDALPGAVSDQARASADAYRRAVPHLAHKPSAEHASYLELAAHRRGAQHLADVIAATRPGRPWSARWADQIPVGDDRILGWHDGPVRAVAVGEQDGNAVVVSGGCDGMVRVWDLRTGQAQMEWRHGVGDVEAIAIGELSVGKLAGSPVVVSGGDDGKLRRWHLASGAPYGEPLDIGSKGGVTSAAVGDLAGRPFIVAAYRYGGTIGLWDLDTGQQLDVLEWEPDPAPGFSQWEIDVHAVAAGRCNDRPIIIAGHKAGVHLWAWTGSGWVAKRLISDVFDSIWTVALGALGGRPIAVCGGNWQLTTLDLGSGKRATLSYKSPDMTIIGVAVGELDGRTVAVSSGYFGADRGILRVWDLAAAEKPLRGSLVGHHGGVKALAITRLDCQPVLVTGGLDHTVRIWDLAVSLRRMPDRIEHQTAEWIQACELSGHPVVVSKGFARVSFSQSWVWRKKADDDETDNGRLHHRSSLKSGSSTVEPHFPDVETSSKPFIRVWDQATGMPIDAHSLDLDHLADLRATGHAGSAVLGVSVDDPMPPRERASREKTTHLRVRDLRNGTQVGLPIPINGGVRYPIAIGGLGDRPVVVFCDDFPGNDDFPGTELLLDERLQAWDVRGRRLLWEPLPAYHDRGQPFIRAFGILAGQPTVAVTALGRFGIWDLERGELIAEPPSMQGERWLHIPAAIGELAGRPVVVYCGYGRPIRLWDMTADHECRRVIEVDTEISAITIAPDSTIIAAGPAGALALRVETTFFEPMPASRTRRTKAKAAEVHMYSVTGPADWAYLDSISPGQPREEDLEHYAELKRHLSWLISENELHSGYDHFGRLVLYGTRPAGFFNRFSRMIRRSGSAETLFAVGWPFMRLEYRPLWSGCDTDLADEAVFRGEPGHGARPVYISLPDERIDLLPEAGPDWGFGWGYGGSSPGRLETAICRAAGLLRGRQWRTYSAFQRWLEDLVEEKHRNDRPLEIRVGVVRAKFQELQESSGK